MFKKVIVSHLGELAEDTRTVGDRIRYRIYYRPLSLDIRELPTDIVVIDPLDEGLARVTVFNDGRYDARTHTVRWRVDPSLLKEGVVLEFEAVITSGRQIHNQAFCEVKGLRETKTNVVETKVSEPPALGWIPFVKGGTPEEPPRTHMKDETTTGLTVNFDVEGMSVQEVLVDGVAYHRLSMAGQATLLAVGKPELPILGGLVEVPHGVDIKPTIVKSSSIPLEGYNVYPAQEPIPRRGRAEEETAGLISEQRAPKKRTFALDKTTYLTKADYPAELAAIEIEDVGVIRGHRVVFLKVHPLQFNPVTRELRAFSNIEVRLEYGHPAQIERIDQRIESDEFEAMLRGSVLNYREPARFDRGDGQSDEDINGCHYLILTHESFYTASDADNPVVELRNWKQRKGLITRVVDVATIPGGNTANAIQAYIQDAYDTWNPAPAYVLLVGDADLIPTNDGLLHSSHRDANNNSTPLGTDLPYVLVDGTDYFPDIYLGRLSVDTPAQAKDVVDKIIAYEQNPPATPAEADFYANTSLVSLFEDDRPALPGGAEGDGTEDGTFRIIEFAEAIRDYLNGLGYNAQRIYSRSGNYAQGPERYEDGTSLPDELTLNGNPAAGIPGFPWTGGAADIRAAIDAGNFIVTYNGHGGRTNWSRPAFNTGDVANLNNGNLTPVIFSFACQCGWFDNETDHADLGTGLNDESLCEHLLRRANGGAVAVVGATRNSWDNNDFMMLGVYKAIWPDFAPNPPSSRAVPQMQIVPLARMGQIHTFCKIFMANAYGHDFNRQSSFEMYHLFGDPEIPVWTRAPGELEVKHPSGVGATGAQDLVVKVTDKATHNPVQSAVVTLTRTSTISGGPVDRIIQTQQTDPAGVARFALYSVGDGDIDVTVTALNYRPYMGVMTVISGGAQLTVDPDDGVEGQNIHVIGQGFSGNENVDIYFDDQWMLTTAAQGGDFGQAPSYVDIQVPSPHAHQRVNVTAVGQTSGRCAVDVFQVRDANPVDLWTYSQWDNTTWGSAAGPTWNSPDIQLYNRGGQPVASNNLTVGESYTVKVDVHNNSAFQAQQARIVFRWANYGVGGPWNEFHTDTQDVPPAGATAEAPFTPGATGHLCLRVEIFHAEDITPDNNQGQENLHVGPTTSPTEVCFLVWNLTKEPAAVFLEVRQLPRRAEEQEEERLWGTWVVHPDPQVLEPGDRAEACVVVDPDLADARPGTTAEFAVTGFINGTMIGGVNLLMTKK